MSFQNSIMSRRLLHATGPSTEVTSAALLFVYCKSQLWAYCELYAVTVKVVAAAQVHLIKILMLTHNFLADRASYYFKELIVLVSSSYGH